MNRKIRILLLLLLYISNIHAINVVFRLDDPLPKYDSITMRVVSLFNDKQLPLVVAMIPFDSKGLAIKPISNIDSMQIEAMSGDNIEIALHGFSHENFNNKGEFGGSDKKDALYRITKGKNALEMLFDKQITTFIPPYNKWNENTISGMQLNDLGNLSADMYIPIYAKEISYFPETLGPLMINEGIWDAAERVIFNCKVADAIVVVMFHAYDLPDEHSWESLAKLLDACKTNEKIKCHTFQSLQKSGVSSSVARYRANHLHSGLQKYFLHPGVLYSTELCWLVHVLNAILYALVPLLLLIGWFYSKKTIYLLATVVGSSLFGVLALLYVTGPMKLLVIDIVYVCGVGICIFGLNKIIRYKR